MILGLTILSLGDTLLLIIVSFGFIVYVTGRLALRHPGKALKCGRFLWFYLRK